jgi:ubiquinone/menaquinone biosynthesis C-methylase UbiE
MMKLQRRFKDLGIGGITARWYDNNTRKSTLAEMKAYAREVAKHIQEGFSVLEVAPGPGYLAIKLGELGNYIY